MIPATHLRECKRTKSWLTNSMKNLEPPLRASLSGYCAAVRKPLHLPTTDAAVLLVSLLLQPPPVSWLFFLLARQVFVPSAVDHCLPQKVPKCSAPPVLAVSVADWFGILKAVCESRLDL